MPPPAPVEATASQAAEAADQHSDFYQATKASIFNALINTIDLAQLAQLDVKAAGEETRLRILTRDGFRCFAPGCERRATICDHILSRRNGGSDDDGNLRSACSLHDNRIKEDASGQRRSGGRPGGV